MDIGLETEEVKAKVSIGDVVVSMPNMLWHSEYRISEKALDNRLGVYVVSQVMNNLANERPLHNSIIGVVISLNVDCDITLSKQLELIAKQQGITYQISARPHATGGTNISCIQLARNGIRTISLGIPCRYMHTPVEMCDMRDVNAAIQLLTLFCAQHKI